MIDALKGLGVALITGTVLIIIVYGGLYLEDWLRDRREQRAKE